MSEDQEVKGGYAANDENPDEEVRAHVKKRDALDEGSKDDAQDDVQAHVKSHRGIAGDDGDGEDEVRAHVKSSRG